MILGSVCTRNCRFCAVDSGTPQPVDAQEPTRVAQAAAEMQLRHVVITSVTRDDLPDEGAGHFAACIKAVRAALPQASIEVLTPDFHARPDCLDAIRQARPTVFNHNLETVEALAPRIRPQADYRRSLRVLRYMAEAGGMWSKSGLMVGLGERDEQVLEALRDLRGAGCRIVTIGQYLAPSGSHYRVQRYLPPEWFDRMHEEAMAMGFTAVHAGPFVRSSYLAGELLPE